MRRRQARGAANGAWLAHPVEYSELFQGRAITQGRRSGGMKKELKKIKNMPSTGIKEILPNEISFEMVFVEGGTFMMGSAEEDAFGDEQPVHEASISASIPSPKHCGQP